MASEFIVEQGIWSSRCLHCGSARCFLVYLRHCPLHGLSGCLYCQPLIIGQLSPFSTSTLSYQVPRFLPCTAPLAPIKSSSRIWWMVHTLLLRVSKMGSPHPSNLVLLWPHLESDAKPLLIGPYHQCPSHFYENSHENGAGKHSCLRAR